jgi:hypothetical protein
MPNRKTQRIDVNLDLYMVYRHKPTDSPVAIDKSEADMLQKLTPHGSFEAVTESQMIAAVKDAERKPKKRHNK